MIAIANNVPTPLTEPERIGSRINKCWSKNRNHGHAWRYDREGAREGLEASFGFNFHRAAGWALCGTGDDKV
jgi:hypothetical protein